MEHAPFCRFLHNVARRHFVFLNQPLAKLVKVCQDAKHDAGGLSFECWFEGLRAEGVVCCTDWKENCDLGFWDISLKSTRLDSISFNLKLVRNRFHGASSVSNKLYWNCQQGQQTNQHLSITEQSVCQITVNE